MDCKWASETNIISFAILKYPSHHIHIQRRSQKYSIVDWKRPCENLVIYRINIRWITFSAHPTAAKYFHFFLNVCSYHPTAIIKSYFAIEERERDEEPWPCFCRIKNELLTKRNFIVCFYSYSKAEFRGVIL